MFDIDGEEIYINKVMIEKGFVKEMSYIVDNFWNIEVIVKFDFYKVVGFLG